MAAVARRTRGARAAPARRPTGGARLLALAAAASAAASALPGAFVMGGAGRSALRSRVVRMAEAEGKTSVALVKVTEENKATTASLLGGLAGLAIGGVWVGGALFAASAYLSKKEDDDVSKALKGVAAGGIEVLNFGAYLNDKYAVTDKIGGALSEAIDKASASASSASSTSSSAAPAKETSNGLADFVTKARDAISEADKEIGFKETFGTLATSAADLAFQAVDKAVETNEKYKLTDQIVEKVQEVANSAKSSTTSGSTPAK